MAKSFSNWTTEEVEDEFGLIETATNALLDAWLTIDESPSEFEKQWLEPFRLQLDYYSYTWNEQELIGQFIGPLLTFVNFNQTRYRTFMERDIVAPHQNDTLSGTVDFLIAQGKYSPKQSFFFLHEYKKENDSSNDPRGQLLIAMVAAQILNPIEQPIYGAYILGRHWHLVVLDGKEYAVHSGLNAAKQEIEIILGALKNMKTIINRMIDIPRIDLNKL